MPLQLPELTPFAWVLCTLAAMVIGMSKTAVPGINTISIAIFAAFLPPKESTAAMLLLLIVGDVFALVSYRRHVHWPTLVRLIPAVAIGLAIGALFLAFAGDSNVRRAIGIILLCLVLYSAWQRWKSARTTNLGDSVSSAAASASSSNAPQGIGATVSRVAYGTLGGFTTMVANAGGAPMSLYFLSVGFPVKAFLGTAAWFFAIINLSKVPIMVGLGLFVPNVLSLALCLVPGVVVGAFAGRWIASRIKQHVFEYAILAVTTLGAIYLLL